MRLTQIIEALLFASDAPLSAADLSRVDERLDEDTVEAVVQELRAEYELSERSFQIYEVAGGYQLLTRPEFVSVLERYDTVPQPSRLSAPGLEVLAIIAYRQPLGRAEIEEIRGVGSSGVLRTLQERHLIEPVGRGEGLGRPLLYGTTKKFLEHFGFRSLEDLPRPDDLPIILRERPQPVEPGADELATAAEANPGSVPESDIATAAAAVDEAAAAEHTDPADVAAVVAEAEATDAHAHDVDPDADHIEPHDMTPPQAVHPDRDASAHTQADDAHDPHEASYDDAHDARGHGGDDDAYKMHDDDAHDDDAQVAHDDAVDGAAGELADADEYTSRH
jgi:segregation and condensation protein B